VLSSFPRPFHLNLETLFKVLVTLARASFLGPCQLTAIRTVRDIQRGQHHHFFLPLADVCKAELSGGAPSMA